jgi:hypothetical protein
MGFRRFRPWRSAAIALVLIVGTMAIGPSGTLATTTPQPCTGHQCDGKSPHDTKNAVNGYRCDGSTEILQSTTILTPTGKKVGTVNLVYSRYCLTIWAQVANFNFAGYQATGVSVVTASGTLSYDYTLGNCAFCIDKVTANQPSYGYQIYAFDAMAPGNSFFLNAWGYICGSSSTCVPASRYSASAVYWR